MAILRDRISSGKDAVDQDDSRIAGILYAGQGRYVFKNKRTNKQPRKGRKRKRVEPLSIMGRFNCGDPSHILKNCPKDVDLTRAAKGGLEYLEKKTGKKRNAHTVLFALCQQLTVTEE